MTRPFFVVILSLFFVTQFVSLAAAQQECECTLYPLEGRYDVGGGGYMDLSYSNNEAGQCPTGLNVFAPRGPDANDANVLLYCAGETWTGTENTVFQSETFQFEWNIYPEGDYEQVARASVHPEIFEGSTLQADRLRIEVQTGLKTMNRTIELVGTSIGGARAAECICATVRDAREDAITFRDAYANQQILGSSIADGVGATTSIIGEHIDDQNVYRKSGAAAGGIPYKDRVEAAVDAQVSEVDAPPASMMLTNSTFGALASVNAQTCEITPPDMGNSCVPVVIMQAVLAHETLHVRQCVDGRRAAFQTPDGRTVFPKGTGPADAPYGEGFGISSMTGNLVDMTGSNGRFSDHIHRLRIKHPQNYADSEVAAHNVEIDYYDGYLQRFCR